MLRASNIHYCIKNRAIIDQMNLELNPGEIMAILGPNGAGKSTFFKVLSGEIACKQGTVHYNGNLVHQLKPKQLAEIRAVMPQHSQLNFPFSAEEVVRLGLISSSSTEPENLISEIMEVTNTGHLREKAFNYLSGGEKQRVHLARVLVQIWENKPFPRFLLLDEPTSSLDISQQHAVLKILDKLKSRNIGILLILHELNLAIQYADKIALLKNGTIVKTGEVNAVMEKETLDHVFEHPIQLIKNPYTGGLIVSSSPEIISNLSSSKLAYYGNL
ncbi:heme ABC transporter ATP-binding protein [Algoriphagus lutimaris]|uniref:heme ABC transporter ATP-binding protein n=1 Tax=Algoriphagus lutimaris TaxID=613197 RepID=UPI00196A7C0B|nr:heme ABC transporter ATP-binding protein [Algoriphagus lutimaris]MBN3518800.1 heme ABC transporter ATP-binding protein [Algoriphagus lutimaris]